MLHIRSEIKLKSNLPNSNKWQIFFFNRKPAPKPSNHETSPSGGEKLLRLLSVSEQRNDENKENGGGGSVAAFFAQVSQASNTTSGPPPPALPAATQPRMDPLQSLYTDPAVVSTGPMPPLPVAAKAASDLESDLKPTKAKKAGHGKLYFQPLKLESTHGCYKWIIML